VPRARQVLLGARSGCFIALGQRQFPELGGNLEPSGARARSQQEISGGSRGRVACQEAFAATRSSSLSPTDAKGGHRLQSFCGSLRVGPLPGNIALGNRVISISQPPAELPCATSGWLGPALPGPPWWCWAVYYLNGRRAAASLFGSPLLGWLGSALSRSGKDPRVSGRFAWFLISCFQPHRGVGACWPLCFVRAVIKNSLHHRLRFWRTVMPSIRLPYDLGD
jgi:hypothetical protein